MYFLDSYSSPVGKITIASDGENLTGLWIEGQKHFGFKTKDKGEVKSVSVLRETKMWLEIYFSGKEPNFKPKIKFEGSEFQVKVWKILEKIPYGETVTYGQIAKQLAGDSQKKMSAQAVGGAVGRNPISIIVPCHRVIGAKNKLTGYDGGIEKKIFLLNLEGINI